MDALDASGGVDGLPLWAVLVLFVAIMAMMFMAGTRIQRSAHFIYPKDPVTILLVAAIAINAMLLPVLGTLLGHTVPRLGISHWWYLPVLAGYFVGYASNVKREWVLVTTVDQGSGDDVGWHEVFFPHPKDPKTLCVQDQTVRALVARWWFGIYHTTSWAGVKLTDARAASEYRKYAWWPIMKADKKYWMNAIEPQEPINHDLWKAHIGRFHLFTIRVKERRTRYTLADAHQVSQEQFIRSFRRLDDLNVDNAELRLDLNRMRNDMDEKIAKDAVILAADVKKGDPVRTYLDRRKREMEERKEAEENEE